ncbi:hypothetical protein CcaverHIS002_0101850 [Cutaneotrichosporon cavernicola]|nr:hypothetical protein CcaverHIS002_0101850 [Cutaneotrichosporon cavernicola]
MDDALLAHRNDSVMATLTTSGGEQLKPASDGTPDRESNSLFVRKRKVLEEGEENKVVNKSSQGNFSNVRRPRKRYVIDDEDEDEDDL